MDEQEKTEMIVRIDQKVTDMSISIEKDQQLNTKAHDEILSQIKSQRKCILDQNRSFVPSKLFYWVIGFIILGVLALGGITSNNSYSIGKIETKIERNINK